MMNPFEKRMAINKLKELVSEIKWPCSIENIDHVISHVEPLAQLAESLDCFKAASMVICQLNVLQRYIERGDESAFHAVLAANVSDSIRFLEERIYDQKTSKERD
jgi:hypothetical protein